jgi:hypothetical protein
MLFRQIRSVAEVRQTFQAQLDGVLPAELAHLFDFLDLQAAGKMGRQREAFRNAPPAAKAA